MTDLPEAPRAVADPPGAVARAGTGARPAPASTGRDRTRAVALRLTGGWPLGRIIGAGVLVAGLFSILAIVVGGAALANLNSVRGQAVDTLDPAAYRAAQLEVALLNQE